MKWPRIRSRRTTAVSPWVSIIAREVEFSRGAAPQTYHAVEQADYISIVALTPSGKIPIVRQYRPALEAFAWELPAGLVDPGEDPADGCFAVAHATSPASLSTRQCRRPLILLLRRVGTLRFALPTLRLRASP